MNSDSMILPNFLIIGAEKSGTTALANFVSQHPDICFSRDKESFFFTTEYTQGVEYLASHFNHYSGEKAIGEGTARMLQHFEAPERIFRLIPKCELFCILRNPIDRAFSQYNYYIHAGGAETMKSFGELIRDKKSDFGQDIVRQGFYIDQLKRYEEFFDRKQINVFLYNDFKRNPVEVAKNIYRQVGVNTEFIPSVQKRHNTTKYPKSVVLYYLLRRSWGLVKNQVENKFPSTTDKLRKKAQKIMFKQEKSKIETRDRIYLQKIYEPYNRQLGNWLGKDLSHWV